MTGPKLPENPPKERCVRLLNGLRLMVPSIRFDVIVNECKHDNRVSMLTITETPITN
jgi:uncharacterized protein (UPF0179 family)